MPRGDGTGPAGQGPMTGRRMGYCAGFNVPGFMNFGFGRGFGRGFSWRREMPIQQQVVPIQQIQPQVITEQQEREMLEQELELIKQEMNEIQKRLKELK